ncbi:MAG TPA: peptidylprolyl isomerase [Rhodanobacteraceae bacterium]
MKPISTLFVFALAMLLAPLAHAQFLPGAQPGGPKSNQPAVIDRIVAVVEDNVILQSQLDQAVATVKRRYANDPQKLPPANILRRSVLNQLILMNLQVQHAEQQGIRVSQDEVSNAIANIAGSNHMNAAQLRQAVASNGGSYNAFVQNVANQIIVQKLRNQVVQSKVHITSAEIDNLLKNPSFSAAQVHLEHIMIPLPDGATPDDIAAARAKAEKAEKAIAGGMDFNTAAIRYSGAADALKGGDLGWRSMSEIPQAFVELVTKMQPGQVTPPLRGPSGFQILKLVARRKAGRHMATQYHARQILIKPSELLTNAQAQQKAENLYADITKKHKNFATLAKQESDDDTSANLGGDLGWFALKAHGPAVANALASLKDGQVSRPFQTPVGWDIIQRLGTRQKDVTQEMRRERARQEIGNRKAQEVYAAFVRQLRSSSYVNIRIPSLRDPSKQTKTSS